MNDEDITHTIPECLRHQIHVLVDKMARLQRTAWGWDDPGEDEKVTIFDFCSKDTPIREATVKQYRTWSVIRLGVRHQIPIRPCPSRNVSALAIFHLRAPADVALKMTRMMERYRLLLSRAGLI